MPILMGVAAAAARRKAGTPRPTPAPPTAAIARKSRLLMVVPLLGERRRSEDRAGRAPSTLTCGAPVGADDVRGRIGSQEYDGAGHFVKRSGPAPGTPRRRSTHPSRGAPPPRPRGRGAAILRPRVLHAGEGQLLRAVAAHEVIGGDRAPRGRLDAADVD